MPDTNIDLSAWGVDLGAYRVFTPPDPFEDHVGPIYHRIEGDARAANTVHCVLPTTEAQHRNAGGVLHGGALITFADYALCLIAGRAADGGTNSSFALTVNLSLEFTEAGKVGPPLEARGEPLQVTGRLAFARGSIVQEGRTLALWSGVCRHVARDKAMARKDASALEAPAIAVAQPVPAGYAALTRPSNFMNHVGAIYSRRDERGTHVIQPTLPHQCNSGGVLHGGFTMGFADNALITAVRDMEDKYTSTVHFSAEFLAAGDLSAPLETLVEVPRMSRSLAFTRGVVMQGDRRLLSYSALVALRDRKT